MLRVGVWRSLVVDGVLQGRTNSLNQPFPAARLVKREQGSITDDDSFFLLLLLLLFINSKEKRTKKKKEVLSSFSFSLNQHFSTEVLARGCRVLAQ